MADRQHLEQLAKHLADEGRLIEAGWVGLRIYAVPLDCPPAQVDDMRLAFMAGAQHLFTSIMTILDDGVEATESDMVRMDLISKELQAFEDEVHLRAAKPEGQA